MSILAGLEAHHPAADAVLETIDSALADWGAGGDSMRWKPAAETATVMFTWDCDSGISAVLFEDVKAADLRKLRTGERVWADGEAYHIAKMEELPDGSFFISLITAEQ